MPCACLTEFKKFKCLKKNYLKESIGCKLHLYLRICIGNHVVLEVGRGLKGGGGLKFDDIAEF